LFGQFGFPRLRLERCHVLFILKVKFLRLVAMNDSRPMLDGGVDHADLGAGL
jgi:hypothetical protein